MDLDAWLEALILLKSLDLIVDTQDANVVRLIWFILLVQDENQRVALTRCVPRANLLLERPRVQQVAMRPNLDAILAPDVLLELLALDLDAYSAEEHCLIVMAISYDSLQFVEGHIFGHIVEEGGRRVVLL